jgi:hypothetical protein
VEKEKGKILRASNAFLVEQLISGSTLKVREPQNVEFMTQLSRISNLHQAEIEVLRSMRT